jgi:hypothetical protein
MKRTSGKASLLFLFLIAFALVLKPVIVYAAIESLVHPTLVSPKTASSTLGVPVRSCADSYRMDKMEANSTVDAFLKVEISKTAFYPGLRTSFNQPVNETPGLSRPLVLRI